MKEIIKKIEENMDKCIDNDYLAITFNEYKEYRDNEFIIKIEIINLDEDIK